ncbi:MAG: sulfatase [Lentisphaeria bacterium]|nr:sulfatase [Lentisphaeria bacterium]
MCRRDFLAGTATLAAGAVLRPVLGAAPDRAPNILMIPVDDLKPLLGCYGVREVLTPHIDRLAARGTVFLNNCCQQAVCGPTRASLMTGLYPDSTGVWDLATRMRDVHPDVLSLPQYLIQRGYECTGVGKTYDSRCVGKGLDEPSWSIPYGSEALRFHPDHPRPAGHYHHPETREAVRLGQEAIQGQTFRSGSARNRALSAAAGSMAAPATECMDLPDDAYADGALAAAGCRLLERLAAGGKPFFLSVGFLKPHLPFVAPKRYWDLYDPRDIVPHAFQERARDGVEIAYHDSGELRSYSDVPLTGGIPVELQRRLLHGYRACVSYIDAQVGRLLDQLDALGIAGNTIVCLWGDHGWHLGDHAMWCKHSNFEQAVRSPLIVAAPGIAGGRTTSAPTGFVDVFPTLCDLAGVPLPAHLHGSSLVPLMSDPSGSVREAILSQYPRGIDGLPVMGYTLRDRRYRYVKWLQLNYRGGERRGRLVGRELYDYETDPHETVNRAADPALATVVERFEDIFARMGVAVHTGVYEPAREAPVVNGVGGVLYNGLGKYLAAAPQAVSGQSFDECVEARVTVVPGKTSEAAYKRPVMIPLAAGKTYRLSFRCRSGEGAEFTAIFQRNGSPYTNLARTTVQAHAEWQQIELIGRPEADFGPAGTVLTCHLGGRLQTVQFADVRAEEIE